MTLPTALFTGAGSSRAIGYPLTKELLPRVLSELESGALFADTNGPKKDKQDRNELRSYLLELLPGVDQVADHELPLITDVFSLIEHALVSGESLPIGGDGPLRNCRKLLKQAITDVLLGDFLTPWDEGDTCQKSERISLGRLVHWLRNQGDKVGLVTTNYDIGLEYEIYRKMGRPRLREGLDLGFDWRDVGTDAERTRPNKPALRVYKLHGSLDLLRCPLCGYVYFNEWGAIAIQAFREKLDDENTCVCRDDARLDLHIVSPSLVREVREANLLSVWRSALEWMRTTDRWIIVGYSLPPEDLAVRSLLLRAYATAPRKPQITVVQLGTTELPRYKVLFPDCRYEADGLEAFLANASA